MWLSGWLRVWLCVAERCSAGKGAGGRLEARGIPEREPRTQADTQRHDEERSGMGLGAFPKGSPEPQPRRDEGGRIVGGFVGRLWVDYSCTTDTQPPDSAQRARRGGRGFSPGGGRGCARLRRLAQGGYCARMCEAAVRGATRFRCNWFSIWVGLVLAQ